MGVWKGTLYELYSLPLKWSCGFEMKFSKFCWNLLFCQNFSLEKSVHGPSFEQTCSPSIQGCFVPSLLEFGPMTLKKMIFLKVVNKFSIFCYEPSLEKGVTRHLNKLPSCKDALSSLSKDALCKAWLKLAQWF